MSAQESKKQNRPRTKAGRTLLVKPSNGNFNVSVFEGLAGLTSKHHTDKSNSHFLTFSTPQEALTALKKIKGTQNARVKFAHYRIFFKMEGLTESSDYNTIKTAHTEMVNKLGGEGSVLYYRLYRKDNKFIGCGDMTVDTKDVFDKTLSSDTLKEFKGEGFSGTHYRYKKNGEDNQHSKDGDE